MSHGVKDYLGIFQILDSTLLVHLKDVYLKGHSVYLIEFSWDFLLWIIGGDDCHQILRSARDVGPD